MNEELVTKAEALYLLAIENHFNAIKTSGNFDELNIKDYKELSSILYKSINKFAQLSMKIDKHIKLAERELSIRKSA